MQIIMIQINFRIKHNQTSLNTRNGESLMPHCSFQNPSQTIKMKNRPPIPVKKDISASHQVLHLNPDYRNLLDFTQGIDSLEQERYLSRLNKANK